MGAPHQFTAPQAPLGLHVPRVSSFRLLWSSVRCFSLTCCPGALVTWPSGVLFQAFWAACSSGSITNTACAVSHPPALFAALLRSAHDGPAFSQVPTPVFWPEGVPGEDRPMSCFRSDKTGALKALVPGPRSHSEDKAVAPERIFWFLVCCE